MSSLVLRLSRLRRRPSHIALGGLSAVARRRKAIHPARARGYGDVGNVTPFDEGPKPQPTVRPTKQAVNNAASEMTPAQQQRAGQVVDAMYASSQRVTNKTGINANIESIKDMNSAQFKEYKNAMQFADSIIGIGMKAGDIGGGDSAVGAAAKTLVLRATDSYITAGERFEAATALADLVTGIKVVTVAVKKGQEFAEDVGAAVQTAKQKWDTIKDAVSGAASGAAKAINNTTNLLQQKLDTNTALNNDEALLVANLNSALDHFGVKNPIMRYAAEFKARDYYQTVLKDPAAYKQAQQQAAQDKRDQATLDRLKIEAHKAGASTDTNASAPLKTQIKDLRNALVKAKHEAALKAQAKRHQKFQNIADSEKEWKAEKAFDKLWYGKLEEAFKSGRPISFEQAKAQAWGDLAQAGVFNPNDATAQALLTRQPPLALQQFTPIMPQLSTQGLDLSKAIYKNAMDDENYWLFHSTSFVPGPALSTPAVDLEPQHEAPPDDSFENFTPPPTATGRPNVDVSYSSGDSMDLSGLDALGAHRRRRMTGIELAAREIARRRAPTYVKWGWIEKVSPSGVSYWVPAPAEAETHEADEIAPVHRVDFSNVNAYLDPASLSLQRTLTGLPVVD